jgi:glycosyltransferase involved in cell wall biosynthesis
VGHVGSFRPEKNHSFALQVAAELKALSPHYWFLFKGDGPLKRAVQKQAHDLRISDRCVFLPSDGEVPRVLRGAVNLFLFPSVLEGLGLALVEAQAAGLRCFVSERLPSEAIAVPEIVEQLQLVDGPQEWARRIHEATKEGVSIDQGTALQLVYKSGFDIRSNATALLRSYT